MSATGDGEPSDQGVPLERLVHNWQDAAQSAEAYLAALNVEPEERSRLTRLAVEIAATGEAWPPDSNACRQTQQALQRVVMDAKPFPEDQPAESENAFLAWRLRAALRRNGSRASFEPSWRGLLCSMPKLARRSMIPNRFDRRGFRRTITRAHQPRAVGLPPDEKGQPDHRSLRARRKSLAWPRAAARRRLLLSVLVLIPSFVASAFMVNLTPYQGRTWLEVAIVLCFGALFGWISIGFWTALMGFFILVRGKDRFRITSPSPDDGDPIDPETRTAIVMPICEEPVERVFAGLRTIYRSLERAGALEHFDFFVLSDTADPGLWVKEEAAWFDWCLSVGGFDRIFYRRRRARIERKSGNVGDFCRRWGERYRYMVILDADSLMAGETLAQLVRLMERHRDVGMIQTAPVAVHRRSLFARLQQFAGRVYGPMFAAGLHYWQLGDGQYWGHNAIIRIAPFMEHCSLPRLPGEGPLGGEILSHDFVEAALMGRAGWSLWLAFDLPGSYEETPSTLLEEMSRDRRWCQGNLQHLQLFRAEGFFGAHRALFLNGVLSYVSAMLWLLFLCLSTGKAIVTALREPDYFPVGASLFPEWPVWRPDWALALMAVTAAILFLPKILSVLLILFRSRSAHAFGGGWKLTLSALLEVVVSSLLAPVRMAFHTRFVVTNLLGYAVVWRSQGRVDSETSWRDAIRHHGVDTLIATVWGAGIYWLNPSYFWWLLPIVGALILSVPVSVAASRVSWGEAARRFGLFLIPEETAPPLELRDLQEELRRAMAFDDERPAAQRDGFVRAALDPQVNALHRALLGGPRSLRPAIHMARKALLERALADGPRALSARERRVLLGDPALVSELHDRVWQLPHVDGTNPWGSEPPATGIRGSKERHEPTS